MCANWSAGLEALLFAWLATHSNSSWRELLELVRRIHKMRLAAKPSLGFSGGSPDPKRTHNEASLARMLKLVADSDGVRAHVAPLEPDQKARLLKRRPVSLKSMYEALLAEVGGYKVAEAIHWLLLERLRPANCWVWMQVLLELRVVDAGDQWLVLQILFGAGRDWRSCESLDDVLAGAEEYD